MGPDHRYAAWVVFDLRLLLFVVLISVLLATGIVALAFKGRRWHEYVTAFVGVFLAVFFAAVFVFNHVADYPVFVVEQVFPFP